MDYAIIGLLVIIVILLIILLVRKNNNSEMNEKLSRTEINVIKEIGDFNHDFSSELNKDFNFLNDRIEKKLNMINDKVNERLEVNFEKTNKTFSSVLERLAKIDEAQKKIDGLSTEIVSLESILTDKKSRGIFGEVNLYHILSSIFGEKNDNIYRTQHTLSNSSIADAIIFGPEPLGTICIDSKFPLENYRRLVEKGLSDTERDMRSKLFESDVNKHIDAIATKYIILNETSDQAIMFLPAEAIFAEINAYHTSLVKYAANKKVWITSPTTLMGLLTIIQSVLMGLERDKYTSVIHEELNRLGIEFGRYKERWDKLSRSIQTVNNDVENIHKTTEKITKRFDSISNVKIGENTTELELEEKDILT
jgi:DNA recombination protein RmuC